MNKKNWFESLTTTKKAILITVATSFAMGLIGTADYWFQDFWGCIMSALCFTAFATTITGVALLIGLTFKPKQTLKLLDKMFSDED